MVAENLNSLYKKIILSLHSWNRLNLCGLRDGGRPGQTKIDCYINQQFHLRTITRYVIFKTQLSTSSASRPGLPLRAVAIRRAFSVTANWLRLGSHWLLQTDSTATDICIYYFIMPIFFRLDHVIFFCLFTQVHFWLTALPSVNTQQTLS